MKGKQFVNLMAYISIALIAIALIVGKILGALGVSATVIGAMNLIANIIAYTITAVYAFLYAKSKKSIGWMIAYIVFVNAKIAFIVLGF